MKLVVGQFVVLFCAVQQMSTKCLFYAISKGKLYGCSEAREIKSGNLLCSNFSPRFPHLCKFALFFPTIATLLPPISPQMQPYIIFPPNFPPIDCNHIAKPPPPHAQFVTWYFQSGENTRKPKPGRYYSFNAEIIHMNTNQKYAILSVGISTLINTQDINHLRMNLALWCYI